MASALTRIGLPATIRHGRADKQLQRLGSDVQTRVTSFVTAAHQLGHDNAAGARALVNDLGPGSGLVVAVVNDLHQLAPTDLALAVLETKACRQRVGLPI
jgi:hypothetical protein